MKAIVFEQPGGEDVLTLGEAPSPTLGDDDIRIRVRATSVNRADLLQRQGPNPPRATTACARSRRAGVRELREGRWPK